MLELSDTQRNGVNERQALPARVLVMYPEFGREQA